MLIDPVERACTLFTEPRSGEYLVRQIVKFGEPVLIPAGENSVKFQTEDL